MPKSYNGNISKAISLERLKIETSNYAGTLNVRDTKRKNERLAKSLHVLGHVTYFSNFGTPEYLWNC